MNYKLYTATIRWIDNPRRFVDLGNANHITITIEAAGPVEARSIAAKCCGDLVKYRKNDTHNYSIDPVEETYIFRACYGEWGRR